MHYYEITVTDSSGQSTLKRVPGDLTKALFVNLKPNTRYITKVAAIFDNIKGQESETATFMTTEDSKSHIFYKNIQFS